MAGLNFVHNIAQALDAGKLFHIDLNGQKPGRFDQDLRFGQEDIKGNFFLVKLLEDNGYDGMRHFDAHALRTSDGEDVKQFAIGCMKTYHVLADKAAQFNADSEIQAIFNELNGGGPTSYAGGYSKESAEQLKNREFDMPAMLKRPLPYEKLDQLVFDLLTRRAINQRDLRQSKNSFRAEMQRRRVGDGESKRESESQLFLSAEFSVTCSASLRLCAK